MTMKQAIEQLRKIAQTVRADYMSLSTALNISSGREYMAYSFCLQKNNDVIYYRSCNALNDLVNDTILAAAAGFPSEPSCDERAGELDDAIAAMEVAP